MGVCLFYFRNDLLYHLVFSSKNQILSNIKRDIRYLFHQSFDIEQGGTYFWMTLILQSSMSCKYNSPDNGMMESFFGILKSEMFYGYEKTFKSIEHLEQAIVDYINYYNNKRIKVKLKHTKISSEEISDGRKYSLLFRYVKVEVSC